MPVRSMIAIAAGLAILSLPAAAQVPYPVYPQPIPQPYPPPYAYQQPDYGVDAVQPVIDDLLGDRYNPDDRDAVGRCASAALMEAERQYRPYGYNRYGRAYPQPYNQPYGDQGFVPMRIVAITDVARWSNGLHVRGLIDSGTAHGGYGNPYGYADPRYAPVGDLRFDCAIDDRGYVSNVRVDRNINNRPY